MEAEQTVEAARRSDPMKLIGPMRYKLSFDAKTFRVTCPKGTAKFSGPATSKLPKLYVVSAGGGLLYVGTTKQSMRNRLRYGFTAAGRGGYYGYAWRHGTTEATLDVWCQEDARDGSMVEMETVEAEVVFLARCAGQWPPGQTEIHFHPSTQTHRDIAVAIWSAATQKISDQDVGSVQA